MLSPRVHPPELTVHVASAAARRLPPEQAQQHVRALPAQPATSFSPACCVGDGGKTVSRRGQQLHTPPTAARRSSSTTCVWLTVEAEILPSWHRHRRGWQPRPPHLAGPPDGDHAKRKSGAALGRVAGRPSSRTGRRRSCRSASVEPAPEPVGVVGVRVHARAMRGRDSGEQASRRWVPPFGPTHPGLAC
jgi:hypothetical protein